MSLLLKLTGRPIPDAFYTVPQPVNCEGLSYRELKDRFHHEETMTASTFSASTTFGSDRDADDKDK